MSERKKETITFILIVGNMALAAHQVSQGNYGLASFNFMTFLLLIAVCVIEGRPE